MTTKQPETARDLRQRAAEKFRANEASTPETFSPEETSKLLHELRVHQIELEMQNEELLRMQHDLEATKASYIDLYELAPVGYLTVSELGLIQKANLAAASMFNTLREALINKPITKFIFREDQDVYYLQRNKISKENEAQDWEIRLVRGDGSLFWAQLQTTPVHNGEYLINFSDITERKQLEIQIQNNGQRMTRLFEISQYPFTSEQEFLDHALDEAIILTASSIGYIYFYNELNRQFTLNSWSKGVMSECSVVEQKTVYDLDSTGIWGEAVRQRKPILLNDYTDHNLLKKGIPEGHVPLKRFLTVPVLIAGEVVAVVGVANKENEYDDADVMQMNLFMDSVWKITAHKRAEEERHILEQQFQQAQKLESLGVLAGGIAHDFNNILTVIICNCSLLKKRPQRAEELVQEIEIAAQRAADLCRQMLIYAGKAQPVPTKFNMAALVEEMIRMLKATISQNVVIKLLPSTDIPSIKADASQIRQIVMNLIINAAEAIGTAQGEICVSLEKVAITEEQPNNDHLDNVITPGWYVCLKVTDNGCGMDEETGRRIFEPFYTTKFTGRGLGMSAVLGIIKAHNGALQLLSQPGQGTTFKVYLPSQSRESTEEESFKLTDSAPWQGSGTVLLAEDVPQLMMVAAMLLKALGFSVIEAVNGKEALELYQKNAEYITLVLTDIGMPVMDGYELFRELKKLNPELPIIISSGFEDADATTQIPREDMAGMLSKPYNFDQLREVLKCAVEGVQKPT
ncbi:MAG: GAF domain-containing protein [Pedobacter sp.]